VNQRSSPAIKNDGIREIKETIRAELAATEGALCGFYVTLLG